MIKRLKRKFILINMFSILLVMFIAFYCNYSFNRANMYSESIRMLESAIEDVTPKSMQTFLVLVNNNDSIYQVRGYTGALTDDFKEVSTLTATALSASREVGDIYGANIRFMKKSVPSGKIIAFTNTTDENLALDGIMRFSTYIGICCAVIFACVSVYLANLATAPVEESLDRRKQFIADASHELKTPLTAIMSSSDVLLESPDVTSDDKALLNGIRSAAEDMSVLVNDMLNLARSEDDAAKRAVETVDFSELAMAVALDYEYKLFEATKVFSSDIDSDIFVYACGNELKQLMVIFLDNARKYSDEHGRIELSLKKHQDKAVLSVFNTGEPIPEDELDKIFERFYRVNKARSSDSSYGLGLSIAKNIADNHATEINVISNPNGTTFSVPFKTVKK